MFDDLLSKVCQNRQEDFRHLVDKGELAREFAGHVKVCAVCNDAVEEAFVRSANAFEALARELAHPEVASAPSSV
ncbi:MAG TPA: hypothetical protein VNG29_00990 [Candidatus Paceibacterota bacterium]|nr:hypothetical protein [Candidatus Paceibacterota bacterium]